MYMTIARLQSTISEAMMYAPTVSPPDTKKLSSEMSGGKVAMAGIKDFVAGPLGMVPQLLSLRLRSKRTSWRSWRRHPICLLFKEPLPRHLHWKADRLPLRPVRKRTPGALKSR